MKRTLAFLLVLSLALPFAASCTEDGKEPLYEQMYTETEYEDPTPLKGRNVVYSCVRTEFFGDMISGAPDQRTKESVYLNTTQIAQIIVVELKDYDWNGAGITFRYLAYVDKIYHNERNHLKEGDVITVLSDNGILPAVAACEELYVKGFESDPSKYGENDIVVCSDFDGIPMEVKGRYIVYLCDRGFEDPEQYWDSSYSYSYGIFDGIYRGADMVKCDLTLEDVEKQIADDLAYYKNSTDESSSSESEENTRFD